jgi:hypothetical protein
LDQLHHLRLKTVDTYSINGFWDVQYEEQKIVCRKPKREADIHPLIQMLLYDRDVLKALEVTPEYPTGGGRLDFLVSGRTTTGEIVRVCVEFKLAHASDLAHGLKTQLPQ